MAWFLFPFCMSMVMLCREVEVQMLDIITWILLAHEFTSMGINGIYVLT